MKFANCLLALVSSSIALTAALDFSNSQWIWTNEVVPGGDFTPGASRAFRRLIPTPQGVTPVLANIIMAVDDSYTLYVNGNQIYMDTGIYPFTGQSFCVPLFSPCGTLIAVTGTNIGGSPTPAALIATIEIMFSDGSTQTVVSDGAWKGLNSSTIPPDYNLLSFDDSLWPNAVPNGIDAPNWTTDVPLDSNTPCGCTSS